MPFAWYVAQILAKIIKNQILTRIGAAIGVGMFNSLENLVTVYGIWLEFINLFANFLFSGEFPNCCYYQWHKKIYYWRFPTILGQNTLEQIREFPVPPWYLNIRDFPNLTCAPLVDSFLLIQNREVQEWALTLESVLPETLVVEIETQGHQIANNIYYSESVAGSNWRWMQPDGNDQPIYPYASGVRFTQFDWEYHDGDDWQSVADLTDGQTLTATSTKIRRVSDGSEVWAAYTVRRIGSALFFRAGEEWIRKT